MKALATAKSKISYAYGTFCAWTFCLFKKLFLCCCGDSSRNSFLGENQSIHTKLLMANEIRTVVC